MHVSPLSWIALTCALVAAFIMLYYLVKRPALDAAGKTVMMLGVGVLPIMVAMIGNSRRPHTLGVRFRQYSPGIQLAWNDRRRGNSLCLVQ